MFYNLQLEVPIGHNGFYYWNNKFVEKYTPGYYIKKWFWKYMWKLVILSENSRQLMITNQQVLTKDSISLRISLVGNYKILNGEKFIEHFSSIHSYQDITLTWEMLIRNAIQMIARDFIGNIQSVELTNGEADINSIGIADMNIELEKIGVVVESLSIKDIGFPKKIQELFAQKLESGLRWKTDLENARTAVATTRTLKNAAKMLKDDENIKFLQYLEAITKISTKWNHNFHFWDKMI